MTARTPAERKRKERQARREAGLIHIDLWTTPDRAAIMRGIHEQPTAPDVAAFLRRWLRDQS